MLTHSFPASVYLSHPHISRLPPPCATSICDCVRSFSSLRSVARKPLSQTTVLVLDTRAARLSLNEPVASHREFIRLLLPHSPDPRSCGTLSYSDRLLRSEVPLTMGAPISPTNSEPHSTPSSAALRLVRRLVVDARAHDEGVAARLYCKVSMLYSLVPTPPLSLTLPTGRPPHHLLLARAPPPHARPTHERARLFSACPPTPPLRLAGRACRSSELEPAERTAPPGRRRGTAPGQAPELSRVRPPLAALELAELAGRGNSKEDCRGERARWRSAPHSRWGGSGAGRGQGARRRAEASISARQRIGERGIPRGARPRDGVRTAEAATLRERRAFFSSLSQA